MKKLLILLITSCLLISCASKKQTDDYEYSYDDDDYSDVEVFDYKAQITDDFVADFEPIHLSDIIVLTKSGKTVKPKQITKAYFVPRRNTLEISFRTSVNDVVISFTKAERDKIIEVCNLFLQQYEEKTVPHTKSDAKSAYMRSKCQFWFGVLSSDYYCSKNDYFLNTEFIDKRPYLLFRFVPSRCDNDKEVTPKVSFYLSPSQTKDFIEILNQEYLNSLVDELNEKAYTY